MKRVVTLDYLRGIAMFAVVAFHAFEKTIVSTFYADLFNMPIELLVTAGLIVKIVNWRGFFLIISGATLTYRTVKAIESGKNRFTLLLNQLISGILLFLLGMLIQVFFNPYWGIYDFIVHGEWTPAAWAQQLQWCDAVEIIALAIILSSIQSFFLLLIKSKFRPLIFSTYYLAVGIAILSLTPIMQDWSLNTFGLTTQAIKNVPFTTWGNRIKIMWLGILVGEQEPLFPYYAISCLGNILGMVIAQPKLKKIPVLLIGYCSGFLISISGVAIWYFILEMAWDGYFMIPPIWLLLVYTGFQIMLFFLFLHLFEFSKRVKIRTKYSKVVRRAGTLSLTMFTLQFLDFIPRWIMTKIFNMDFLGRGNLDIKHAAICAAGVLIFWIVLVLLFGLINNYFSVDWLFTIIKRLIGGKKVYWRDPQNIKNIIRHSEPLSFVLTENKST